MSQILEQAGVRLREELGRPFELTPGAATLFAPDSCDLREEFKRLDSEPLRETVQHLRDLGYLKPAETDSLKPGDESLLEQALLACYADLKDFDDLFAYRLAPGESGAPATVFLDRPMLRSLADPLVITFSTLARLRALTTPDGKLIVLGEPKAGEVSARTRMIHHFLKLYGVLQERFPAGDPYGPQTLAALRGLRALRGQRASETPILRIINALADLDEVSLQFADQFEGKLVWIPGPDGHGDWNTSLWNQRKAIQDAVPPPRAIVVKSPEQPPQPDWEIPNWSVFATRFLQLYLWHRGYYLDELDGLWGPDTQQAFINALAAHGLEGRSNRGDSLWQTDHGFIGIRASSFIRKCQSGNAVAAESNTPDDLFKLRDAIHDQLAQIHEAAARKDLGLDDAEAKVWQDVYDRLDDLDRRQDAKEKSRNFSLGMIGRGIERVIENIRQFANNIIHSVISFAEKVGDFLKNLLKSLTGSALQAFRFLRRSIDSVMRTAILAGRRLLRMATGTPFVSTGSPTNWIITRFDFDQDASSLVGIGVTNTVIDDHFRGIEDENRALEVSLRIGARVLKTIAMASSPVAGGFAAVKLALDVFRTVWDFFREIQKPHTPVPGAERSITFVPPTPAPWRTGMLMAS